MFVCLLVVVRVCVDAARMQVCLERIAQYFCVDNSNNKNNRVEEALFVFYRLFNN